VGIEPKTFPLLERRSNELDYPASMKDRLSNANSTPILTLFQVDSCNDERREIGYFMIGYVGHHRSSIELNGGRRLL
jgi:hypothetical protein